MDLHLKMYCITWASNYCYQYIWFAFEDVLHHLDLKLLLSIHMVCIWRCIASLGPQITAINTYGLHLKMYCITWTSNYCYQYIWFAFEDVLHHLDLKLLLSIHMVCIWRCIASLGPQITAINTYGLHLKMYCITWTSNYCYQYIWFAFEDVLHHLGLKLLLSIHMVCIWRCIASLGPQITAINAYGL